MRQVVLCGQLTPSAGATAGFGMPIASIRGAQTNVRTFNAGYVTMRAGRPSAPESTMSPDAYAGFLKLWLTPTSKIPSSSLEIEAYLSYANEREPVRGITIRELDRITREAA